MRVALFHPDFHTVGGAELLVAMHAGYLAAEGLDTHVATFGLDPRNWSREMGGIPVEVVRRHHWADPFFGFSVMARCLRRARRATAFLGKFDVVVAHNYPCSAMLGYMTIPGRKLWYCHEPSRSLYLREANPKLNGCLSDGKGADTIALQWFRKELEAFEAKGRQRSARARQGFDKAHVGRLEAVAANSDYTRAAIQTIYGRRSVQVIHPAVRFRTGIGARQGLDRSGLKVLVHSRLEPLKNVDTVIRGFARFLPRCPGARLHVVGDGHAKPDLERLAAELLPGGTVQFHGYLPEADLQRVYEACDVLALLPVDEPFGMVFPEAAVKGLLLIGPDHGGPVEIMDEGRLGWPVDAFSPEALAETFNRIWSLEDAEVDRRRREADRACRQRYDMQSIGPQVKAFVQAAG